MPDYLPDNSAHTKYCEENLPHNLDKHIVFISNDDEKVEMRSKLKNWLKDCNNPETVINQLFYNAKLQGPVPFIDN